MANLKPNDILHAQDFSSEITPLTVNLTREAGLQLADVLVDSMRDFFYTETTLLFDEMLENFSRFMWLLTNEQRIRVWTNIAKNGLNEIPFIKRLNPYMIKQILAIYRVVPGDVDQVPVVPPFMMPDSCSIEGRDAVSPPV
jgi:hypothetical protein